MGDEPRESEAQSAGASFQSFVDAAHPVTDEERNRLRLGRPEQLVTTNGRPQVGFPAIVVTSKTGQEPFHVGGAPLGFDLLSFWQWAASDVTNNALRGVIAEYLAARALGLADRVRVEWDRYDLRAACGAAVEVKSAAYFQSWVQTKLSDIAFDIAPTFGWDAATNAFETVARRQADVYVFALLHHRDKPTLDPLDLDQWIFYVLGTKALNAAAPVQKSIRLSRLRSLKPAEAKFATLGETVEQVAAADR